MTPAVVVLPIVLLGEPKLGWLRALKASRRNSKLPNSSHGEDATDGEVEDDAAGALRMLRPELPKPEAGTAKQAGLNHCVMVRLRQRAVAELVGTRGHAEVLRAGNFGGERLTAVGEDVAAGLPVAQRIEARAGAVDRRWREVVADVEVGTAVLRVGIQDVLVAEVAVGAGGVCAGLRVERLGVGVIRRGRKGRVRNACGGSPAGVVVRDAVEVLDR